MAANVGGYRIDLNQYIKKQRQEIVTALSGYLPYGLKVYFKPSLETGEEGVETTLELIDVGYNVFNVFSVYPEDVIPYLRPMSSMTEQEICEYMKLRFEDSVDILQAKHCCDNSVSAIVDGTYVRYWYNEMVTDKTIDWLHEKKFDWRGLIEKNLAKKLED